MGFFTAYLCSGLVKQSKARFWWPESHQKVFEYVAQGDH